MVDVFKRTPKKRKEIICRVPTADTAALIVKGLNATRSSQQKMLGVKYESKPPISPTPP
jgi:hypothetical protein